MRPLAADLYDRYRRWFATAIEAGIASGEFATDRDPDELADLAIAVLDGAGVRALVGDPALEVDRARSMVAQLLAAELGLRPGSLASEVGER